MKSGWRKISFYFNLSYEIKDKTIEYDDNRNVQCAEFIVRAYMQYVTFISPPTLGVEGFQMDGVHVNNERRSSALKKQHSPPSSFPSPPYCTLQIIDHVPGSSRKALHCPESSDTNTYLKRPGDDTTNPLSRTSPSARDICPKIGTNKKSKARAWPSFGESASDRSSMPAPLRKSRSILVHAPRASLPELDPQSELHHESLMFFASGCSRLPINSRFLLASRLARPWSEWWRLRLPQMAARATSATEQILTITIIDSI
ncbi:eukaryotic translation initiation factor 3G1 [Striga asiatica]|uniref:Eukaryotic translation initiation factor 3G1 n=1 Tax=Striga asiatica TaxID=4170 RepID=A0A5A7PKB8_STRAF|nr:eukaryotic translation initiation factor 3G1 [Striga asiatica]